MNTKNNFEVIMAKYKKCPRCELNWIAIEEELCEVCKAELGKESKISLLEEDDEMEFEERICPICKVNYLEEGEDMCASCRQEQADKEREKDDDEGWKEYVDDDLVADEDEELSLNQLQEDEEEEFADIDEEHSPDDFDDDFDSVDDYGDYDDDEDDEDEEEDF